MDCNEINHPERLVEYFRSEEKSTISNVLKCFYEQYHDFVLGFSNTKIFSVWPVRKERQLELFEDAFSDSLIAFFNYIRKRGFSNQGATVRTVFLTFHKRALWKSIEKAIEEDKLIRGGDPSALFDNALVAATPDFIRLKEAMEDENKRLEIFQLAFSSLGERCKNLIRWRKYEKLSNEQIAEKMKTVKPGTVTNEVHECLKKLIVIAKDLKNKN